MRYRHRSLRQTTLHFSEINGPPQTGQTESEDFSGGAVSCIVDWLGALLSMRSFTRGPGASDVESKLDHVAVLHDIFLALDAELAGLARLGKGAESDQVVEMHRFRRDEAALEIGMDHAGRGGRLVAGADGPRPRF